MKAFNETLRSSKDLDPLVQQILQNSLRSSKQSFRGDMKLNENSVVVENQLSKVIEQSS